MMYRSILKAFYSEPLAITAEKLEEIRAFLHLKAAGDQVPESVVAQITAANQARGQRLLTAIGAAVRRPDGSLLAGRTGILPVFGVLSQRVGAVERMSGGISTEEIGASLDSLMADRQVKTIVMVYDTPGGSVAGVQELGDKIRAARDQKKIVGIADSMAASAGLWLISQSSEVAITPGGQMGSHGVIYAHEDLSKALEKEGIKTTLITSAPFKAEANYLEPLTDEARAQIQRKVDYYHAAFTTALAKGRGLSETRVAKDFGQGRMLTAIDAKAAGMADTIATLETILRRHGDGPTAAEQKFDREMRVAEAATLARLIEIQETESRI